MAESFKKHWRLLVFALAVFFILWIIYVLRSVLLPFIIGAIIAYLLLPLITWLEKKIPGQGRWQQPRRVALILLVFLIILAFLGLLSFFVVTAVISSFSTLLSEASDYFTTALQRIQEWTEFIRRHVPLQAQQQIDQWIQNIGTTAGDAVRTFFITTVSLVPSTIGFVFGFAALPLFLFYILKDWEWLRDGFYSAIGPWAAEHARNILAIIDDILGRYIRAQIVLGFTVGLLVLIGLLVMQVNFALVLAIFAGITEVIPTLGPWIGGITALIVTLASTPEKAFWVAILFLVIQLTENTLLVPRIHAGYLHIHPAIVVVLLIVGGYLAGLWGLILAVPLTALAIAIIKYISQAVRTEHIERG